MIIMKIRFKDCVECREKQGNLFTEKEWVTEKEKDESCHCLTR